MNENNIENQLVAGEGHSSPIYEAPEINSHRVSQVVQGDGSRDPDGGPSLPGLTGPNP